MPKEWVDRINNAGGKMKSTSGVPEEQYLPAAKLGVCKVNIDTDGRLVWCAIHREAFRDDPANFDLRPPGKVFMAAYADYIVHKNTMLGSAGQLEGVRKTLKVKRYRRAIGLQPRSRRTPLRYSSSFSGSRRVEQPVVLRLREPHDQQLLLQPAVGLGEEVVAQAARPVRQAAEDEHRAGREVGRKRHVVEHPLRPAGLQTQHALVAHPTLPRLVVVQFGHEFQADPAVGLGKRLHGEDALAPADRSGRRAGPTRTSARAVASYTPEARISLRWPARSCRCRRITRGFGVEVVDLRPLDLAARGRLVAQFAAASTVRPASGR